MDSQNTGASPQSPGTNPSDGKPGDGNSSSVGTGTGNSSQVAPSIEQLQAQNDALVAQNTTLTKNYQDASRESRNQRLAREAAERTTIEAAADKRVSDLPSYTDIATNMEKAMVGGQTADLAATLEQFGAVERTKGASQANAQRVEDTARQTRMTEAANSLQPHWHQNEGGLLNANDPVALRTWQLYQNLQDAHGRGQWKSWIPDDTIDIPGLDQPLNPHIVAEAHQMAQSEAHKNVIQPAATGNPAYTEGVGTGTNPTTQRTPTQKGILLSEDEKATALLYESDKSKTPDQVFQETFDNLDPKVKAVREKTGRIITQGDLIDSAAAAASRMDLDIE